VMPNRPYNLCLSFFSMEVCKGPREGGGVCRMWGFQEQWWLRRLPSPMLAGRCMQGTRKYSFKRNDMCCD